MENSVTQASNDCNQSV